MSMFPIASATPSTNSVVTFNNIPQTFTHLQVRVFARSQGGGTVVNWNINNDATSIYTQHFLYGNGTTPSAGGTVGSTSFQYCYGASSSTLANTFTGNIIDIFDYTNTNKNKVAKSITGQDFNGSGDLQYSSNVWFSTAAITRLDFAFNYAAGSRIDLYGYSISNATGA